MTASSHNTPPADWRDLAVEFQSALDNFEACLGSLAEVEQRKHECATAHEVTTNILTDANDELWAVVDRIAATPAVTLGALRAKARAVRFAFEDELAADTSDMRLLRSLLADLDPQ
jgi:hypothetical protein